MLTGSIVALVTPFDKEGKINEDSLRELVEFHISSGTNGIVVAGCTGESFTLSPHERNSLLDIAKSQANGRIPVGVGTGASDTKLAMEMSENAKELDADFVLVISPVGNKPSQDALYAYYTAIAKVAPPVVVYNVPSRTGRSVEPSTVVKLSRKKNIVAVKEASGSLDAVSYILLHNPDFTVLSGDDALTLPMLAIGARGVISTVANIMPRDMSDMVSAFMRGDAETARALHTAHDRSLVHRDIKPENVLLTEGNPTPLKEAMNRMGFAVGSPRPPLVRISKRNLPVLMDALKGAGLLE